MNATLEIDAKTQETVSLYRQLLELPQVFKACREAAVGKETKEKARALLEPLLQQGGPLERETGQLHLPNEVDYTLLWCLLTKDFRQQTLAYLDLSALVLDGAQFQETTLITVSLAGCSLKGANFDGATLRNVNCSDIMAPDSTWRNVCATEVHWTEAHLWQASFSLREAVSVWWVGAYLESATFEGNLQHGVFIDAYLREARFENADFSHADFTRANMTRVVANKLCAEFANFSYTLLVEAGLSYGTLRGATFSHAQMCAASLAYAEIHYAFFEETDLTGAQLQGANATHSTFTGARFDQVDLEAVDLSYAVLEGAFFYGTSFANAAVNNAHFGETFHINGLTVIPENSHVLLSQLLRAQAKNWKEYRLAAAVLGGARFHLCWNAIFFHVLREPELLPWIRSVLAPIQSLQSSVAGCEHQWQAYMQKNWGKGRADATKNDETVHSSLGDHPF